MKKTTLMVGLLSIAASTLYAHETDLEKEYKDKHARLAVLTIERDYKELVDAVISHDQRMKNCDYSKLSELEKITLEHEKHYVIAVKQKIVTALSEQKKELEELEHKLKKLYFPNSINAGLLQKEFWECQFRNKEFYTYVATLYYAHSDLMSHADLYKAVLHNRNLEKSINRLCIEKNVQAAYDEEKK